MKTAQQWFDEYGESHQNPTNKKIHWICVPVIFFSTLGLLWSIPHDYFGGILPRPLDPYFNWATVLVVIGSVFYWTLGKSIFGGMLLISLVCLWGNQMLASSGGMELWMISLIMFAVAWAGQFVGHKIEGMKPSFFKDLQFLLVGPAWLLSFVYQKVGIRY